MFVRGLTSGERFKNIYCSVYEVISQGKWPSSYEWIFCGHKNKHGCSDVQARIQAGALPARPPPKKKRKEKRKERDRERERERGGEERESKEETIRSIRGKTSAEAFVISFNHFPTDFAPQGPPTGAARDQLGTLAVPRPLAYTRRPH